MAAFERHFCTVLHDVSPQTWNDFRPLVDRCDVLGVPLTLLVNADHHGHSLLSRFPRFCAAVDRRLADASLLRLAVHPAAMRHARAQRFWLDTVTRLAALRQPVTKAQWPESLREPAGPASAAC